MSISDKLVYLSGTKDAIRDAIEQKGVTVPEETTFREYADKISQISGGGGGDNPPGSIVLTRPYRLTVTTIASGSAYNRIRYLYMSDHEGNPSILDLARDINAAYGISSNRSEGYIHLLGASSVEGINSDILNLTTTGTSTWETSGTSGTRTDHIYIFTDLDVPVNVITIRVRSITSTRTGINEATLSRWNPTTLDWEVDWSIPSQTNWSSNETRTFYRPGYTPP